MATARSFAQHYIECENCEENPAQFLCKTCPGHLCDACKMEHLTKKITKNHKVIHLHRNREGRLDILYCVKHTVNKLEWYCSPCKKPVCSKCLMEFHNGHKLEELDKVHNEIRIKRKKEKEQIEGVLLPKLNELLSEKKIKRSEISKRTDEVHKQIEDHAQSLIRQATMMKENAVWNLREEEKKILKSVEETEHEIESRIRRLTKINEEISNSLCADPGITFFNNTDPKLLPDMQVFPPTVNYMLDNFKPGEIFIPGSQFGNFPKFTTWDVTNLQAGEFSRQSRAKAMYEEMQLLESKLLTEQNPFQCSSIRRKIQELKYAFINDTITSIQNIPQHPTIDCPSQITMFPWY